jgi:hypothetical protein
MDIPTIHKMISQLKLLSTDKNNNQLESFLIILKNDFFENPDKYNSNYSASLNFISNYPNKR